MGVTLPCSQLHVCIGLLLGTATQSPVPSTVLFVSPSTINQSTSLTNTGHSMSPDPNKEHEASQSTFLYTYLMDYSVCSECACFYTVCRYYSYSGGGDRGGVSTYMYMYTSRSSHCSCCMEEVQKKQEIKYVDIIIHVHYVILPDVLLAFQELFMAVFW